MPADSRSKALSEQQAIERQIAELESQTGSGDETPGGVGWQRRSLYRSLIERQRKQLAALRAGRGVLDRPPCTDAGPEVRETDQDRRVCARVETDMPAQLIGQMGGAVMVRAVNLSRGGVGLLLDGKTARRLFPSGHPGTRHLVDVRFQLPAPAASPPVVQARGRVVWFGPAAADQFRVGLQFVGFEGNGYQLVESYVADCLPYGAG